MSKLIEFTCPSCGNNLTASSSEASVRCVHCGFLVALHGRSASTTNKEARKLTVPPGVKLEIGEKGLRLEYAWFRWRYVALLPFIFYWLFIATTVAASWLQSGKFPWISIPHIILGFGLLGWAGLNLINRTIMEIVDSTLTIWFEPIPWFGERTLNLADLARIARIKTRPPSRRDYNYRNSDRNPNHMYDHHIYAFLKGDPKEFRLLPYLPSEEASLFVKQILEEMLANGSVKRENRN